MCYLWSTMFTRIITVIVIQINGLMSCFNYLKVRKEIIRTMYMYETSKVLEPRANLRGTSTKIQK